MGRESGGNVNKPYPCFCLDCKYSKLVNDSKYDLRCFHPKVNARDPHSLGSGEGIRDGVNCREERTPHWISWLHPDVCGIKGKLWEQKGIDIETV